MRLLCTFIFCRGRIKRTLNHHASVKNLDTLQNRTKKNARGRVILSFRSLVQPKPLTRSRALAGSRLQSRALPRSPLQRHASERLYGRGWPTWPATGVSARASRRHHALNEGVGTRSLGCAGTARRCVMDIRCRLLAHNVVSPLCSNMSAIGA